MNADLCFVPVEHEGVVKLPAVSGSSGRLVVEKQASAGAERTWPGQLLADESLSYGAAMNAYAAAIQERWLHPYAKQPVTVPVVDERQALRREEEALRIARRQVRAQRRLEDAAWKQLRDQRQVAQQSARTPAQRQALALHWQSIRQQRRVTCQRRQQEDGQWRQQRQALRERQQAAPAVSGWLALLVVVDNCSRQSLGLPLFLAGPRTTTAMVVSALEPLLPPELSFLITDQGQHFKSSTLEELAGQDGFIWIPTARHRPQSNGIAERFVRTLKEWLRDKSWHSPAALTHLLDHFQHDYNNRPHQGLPIPGLSPNEFANRVWLM